MACCQVGFSLFTLASIHHIFFRLYPSKHSARIIVHVFPPINIFDLGIRKAHDGEYLCIVG